MDQQEDEGSEPERYHIALLEARIDSLDVLLDFLAWLHQRLSENAQIESHPEADLFMFVDEWRLHHRREFTERRITEQQLLSHYQAVDDALRDVDRRQDELQPPLDRVTLRSFFRDEFRIIYDIVAPYVRNLRRRLNLLRADMGTVPASEVSSTGGNAAQPPERPADYVDVFDFADISFDRPAEMGAFIINHPLVMHVSEIGKLREAAYRAICERGDREEARDYLRHVIALCYASHTGTPQGLHRMLTAISIDSHNPTQLTQSRLEFERHVELEIHGLDRAAWSDMEAATAEAAHRVQNGQPHIQEHTAVTESEGEEADEDEQGGQHDFDASFQSSEGALLSSSPVEEPHAGGDDDLWSRG